MSRIFTLSALSRYSLAQLHALYRQAWAEHLAAPIGSPDAHIARANMELIAAAIRLRRSGPRPPGF